MTDERRGRAIRLLVDLGAATIEHLTGSLLEHLERTGDVLREWGCSEDLALAGLCHAVYGTDGFPVALLPVDRRNQVSEVIGPDSEAIVYFYAA
jgi:hypothetical protein